MSKVLQTIAAATSIITLAATMSACGTTSTPTASATSATSDYSADQHQQSADMITLSVGDTQFSVQLAQNDTAKAFADMLPLHNLQMSELNSNEKYYWLEQSLPTDPTTPEKIAAGDIMLYQDNCLVVFYADHTNPGYQYTRIGTITDPSGLAEAVGSGDTTIQFTAS